MTYRRHYGKDTYKSSNAVNNVNDEEDDYTDDRFESEFPPTLGRFTSVNKEAYGLKQRYVTAVTLLSSSSSLMPLQPRNRTCENQTKHKIGA